jgi:hypothetical protein
MIGVFALILSRVVIGKPCSGRPTLQEVNQHIKKTEI